MKRVSDDAQMQTDGPLTEQQLEQFKLRGYIKVRAFAREDAVEMVDVVWHRLEKYGIDKEDPSTWMTAYPGGLSQAVRKIRIFREAITDEFIATVDQLLKQGAWKRSRDWGMLLFSFPSVGRKTWDVTSKQWHWHGNPLRNSGHLRDLFVFSFLSQVQAGGGGTLLVEGSHHVVCRFFRELTPERLEMKARDLKKIFYAHHPWLKALSGNSGEDDRQQRFMSESTDVFGYPLRVVELTGDPGEAYITNMSTIHAASMNVLERPRFMRALAIHQVDEALPEST
jgi:hypothetical protein